MKERIVNIQDFVPAEAVAAAYARAHNTSDGWWFAYWCTKFAGHHMDTVRARVSIVNVCVNALMGYGSWMYRRLPEAQRRGAHTVDTRGSALVVITVPPEVREALLPVFAANMPRMRRASISRVAGLVLEDLYRHLGTADFKLDGGCVWREGETLFIGRLAEDFRRP